MRIFRSLGILSASIFLLGVAASSVLADSGVRGVLDRAAPAAGLRNACGSASCIPTIVGGLITWVGGLWGLARSAYGVYAGYLGMTAAGEAKQVEEAQTVLRNAVMGIVVIGFSYTLTGVGLRFIQEAFNSSAPEFASPAAVVSSGSACTPVTAGYSCVDTVSWTGPQVRDNCDVTPGRCPGTADDTYCCRPITAPLLDPVRPGCIVATCVSECTALMCTTLTAQRRFTCESSCQTQCEGRCVRAPVAPPRLECSPMADYRQCLANCRTQNTEYLAEDAYYLALSRRGPEFLYAEYVYTDSLGRTHTYHPHYSSAEDASEQLSVCNNDCQFLYCR